MERGEEHWLRGNRREDGEKAARLFDLVVRRQGSSQLKASVFSVKPTLRSTVMGWE